MKAMQDKIIAIITNMVLSLAIIVVASTMGSDVTGKNEESNRLSHSEDQYRSEEQLRYGSERLPSRAQAQDIL